MNGSGKSGIYTDPNGDLIANANTIVRLSVRSASGASALQSVQYGSESISIHQNSFTLKISAGINLLRLIVQNSFPEVSELLDSNGQVLSRFDSEVAFFRINGELMVSREEQ